ncbi:MAG: hypothetical protein CSA52_01345 [Gammaproteobacteria bacterium]|nr:MAG: hypothetical protein CSB48_09855 [Pseudomonadota bacterium]PIE38725.1 MAG: hypothetical protein CSA52_01345 [Gammaproteobacteria bacterium]
MFTLGNKKIVCITGTVSSARENEAPRYLLVKEGFRRPVWFTSYHSLNDADYEKISDGSYHVAKMNNRVLADMEFGNGHVGIFTDRFEEACRVSELGVLVAAHPQIVTQIVNKFPTATIFALKAPGTELTSSLKPLAHHAHFHRMDIDLGRSGVWTDAVEQMKEHLGI